MTEWPLMINYWIAIILLVFGLYIVAASSNLVKKIVGLNIFQAAVFILYINMGKVFGGSAPIISDKIEHYSNPLPHVLILTAIVVGVATTALGLALIVRIKQAYGSIEENEINQQELNSNVSNELKKETKKSNSK